MVYLLPLLVFGLSTCGGSSAHLAPEQWSGSVSSPEPVVEADANAGSAMAMLRSTRSENGFYGTDAQAEINQITRFLEGR